MQLLDRDTMSVALCREFRLGYSLSYLSTSDLQVQHARGQHSTDLHTQTRAMPDLKPPQTKIQDQHDNKSAL